MSGRCVQLIGWCLPVPFFASFLFSIVLDRICMTAGGTVGWLVWCYDHNFSVWQTLTLYKHTAQTEHHWHRTCACSRPNHIPISTIDCTWYQNDEVLFYCCFLVGVTCFRSHKCSIQATNISVSHSIFSLSVWMLEKTPIYSLLICFN